MKPLVNRSNIFHGMDLRVFTLCLLIVGVQFPGWSQEINLPDEQPTRKSAIAKPEPLPDADPKSAALPKKWFKLVPVKPTGGLGLSPDENEPYYRILDHVKNLPAATLAEAARKFRLSMIDQFAERTVTEKIEAGSEAQKKSLRRQLEKRLTEYREDLPSYPLIRDAFNQSEKCQGQVVSFSGHIRQAISFPAGENEFGIKTLYQVTLFDEESKGYPVIIICTEVPDGLPLNFPETQVYDGVSVTGYYFKLFAYEGKEDLQAVPLILAKTVSWSPPEPSSRAFPDWGYGFVIAVGVVVLWMIVRSNRSTKRLQSVREKLSSPEDNPFDNPN
ncbi:MAG: hypothetical protein P8M30_09345 [Planctomycetaceae bacterium]|nr:hypothetical protein [Planctomycetaceae bacterium]MDG2389506.1 hypothetical protein [Planctomycetaceae bacterium]